MKPKLALHVCCAICGAYLAEYFKADFEPVIFFYNPNIHPAVSPDKIDKVLKIKSSKQKSLCLNDFTGRNSRAHPPQEEYEKRKQSVKKLAEIYNLELIEGEYEPEKWFENIKGFELEPEGGARCPLCFKMRLLKTAEYAKEQGIKYFATTLSISPYKQVQLINQIGEKISRELDLEFVPMSEELKSELWQKSRQLARKYNFYHQKYCGCIFSQKNEKAL